MRSYLLSVALQTLAILAAVGLLVSGGVMLTRPWWGRVQAATLRPCGQWRPYLLPDREFWCWWPDGWIIREEGQPGTARVVFEAGSTARVTVVVTSLQGAGGPPAPVLTSAAGASAVGVVADPAARALEDVLQSISRRPGFWHGPSQPVTTRLGEGRGVFFSHWNISGLRPIAWYGWLCAVSVDGRLVMASATCDGENVGAFAWPAVRLIKSLKAWSGRDLTPEETGPSPEEEAKRAQAEREAREGGSRSRASGRGTAAGRASGGSAAPARVEPRQSPPPTPRARAAGGQSGQTAAPGPRGPQTPAKPGEPTVKEAAGPDSGDADLAPENRVKTAPAGPSKQEGVAAPGEPRTPTPPPPPPPDAGKPSDAKPATDTDE